MTWWAVLLRGVNVGGGNKLPMADLRASLADAGFHEIATYVQSGNVALRTDDETKETEVRDRAAAVLLERHGLDVPVVARRGDELAHLADGHPSAGGQIPDTYLHVVFLDRAPSDDVDTIDPARFAPDTFELAGREVFITYPNGSGRSKLGIEVFERAWDVTATARNLNTVRKLHELCAI
jgi:uncharacterized protein (DUF1697 family)